MEQTSAARRSFWRFSLRELLLLMLAAGAFIGWGTLLYRSQRLKPTAFFTDNESWHQDVVKIFEELGEPPFKYVSGSTIHTEGPAAVQRTFIFRVPLAEENRQPLVRALQKRVREKLGSAGCKSTGEAAGSGGRRDHAVIGYTNGFVSGTVQICAAGADDQSAIVTLTMHEQRARFETFGIEIRGD